MIPELAKILFMISNSKWISQNEGIPPNKQWKLNRGNGDSNRVLECPRQIVSQ